MKKINLLLACAAVAVFASCESQNLDPQKEFLTVIEAATENVKTALGAKVDNVWSVDWKVGDQISVNNNTSNPLTAGDIIGGSAASFKFAAYIEPTYYALYPASAMVTYEPTASGAGATINLPEVQEYTVGSFDPKAGIMVTSGENNISFHQKMAYIRLELTGTEQIGSIKITSRGGEKLSGYFTTNFTTDALVGWPTTDAKDYVKVHFDSPVAATTPIYVAIPAQNYTNGLNIQIISPKGLVAEMKSKALNAVAGKIYPTTFAYAPKPAIANIVIDGDLSDWTDAITQNVENPAGSMFGRHLKVRFISNGKYVHMLYEVKGKNLYGSIMSDVFFDVDGNPATGAEYAPLFTTGNTGIEVLLEQCLTLVGGGYANGVGYGLYIHGGNDGDQLYTSWKTNPPYNDSMIMCWIADKDLNNQTPADGIVRYEAWFKRSFFGMTGTSLRVGFKSFDWGDGTCGEGYAPQVSKAGDQSYTPCDMFTVQLPDYVAD